LQGAFTGTLRLDPEPECVVRIFESMTCHFESEVQNISKVTPISPYPGLQVPGSHQPWLEALPGAVPDSCGRSVAGAGLQLPFIALAVGAAVTAAMPAAIRAITVT
jgi:hypothetical protein